MAAALLLLALAAPSAEAPKPLPPEVEAIYAKLETPKLKLTEAEWDAAFAWCDGRLEAAGTPGELVRLQIAFARLAAYQGRYDGEEAAIRAQKAQSKSAAAGAGGRRLEVG